LAKLVKLDGDALEEFRSVEEVLDLHHAGNAQP
jgi:hypothetical protein